MADMLARCEYAKTSQSAKHQVAHILTNWHVSCTAQERKALQWVIKTVQNIISTHLLSISDIDEMSWDTKRKHPPHLQPIHPAAVWQEVKEARDKTVSFQGKR